MVYGLFGWVRLGMVHRCLTTDDCRGARAVQQLPQCPLPRTNRLLSSVHRFPATQLSPNGPTTPGPQRVLADGTTDTGHPPASHVAPAAQTPNGCGGARDAVWPSGLRVQILRNLNAFLETLPHPLPLRDVLRLRGRGFGVMRYRTEFSPVRRAGGAMEVRRLVCGGGTLPSPFVSPALRVRCPGGRRSGCNNVAFHLRGGGGGSARALERPVITKYGL